MQHRIEASHSSMCVECAFVRSCASTAVQVISHAQHPPRKYESSRYNQSCTVDLPCEKAEGDPCLRYVRIYGILAKGVLRLAAKTKERDEQYPRKRIATVENVLKKDA